MFFCSNGHNSADFIVWILFEPCMNTKYCWISTNLTFYFFQILFGKRQILTAKPVYKNEMFVLYERA